MKQLIYNKVLKDLPFELRDVIWNAYHESFAIAQRKIEHKLNLQNRNDLIYKYTMYYKNIGFPIDVCYTYKRYKFGKYRSFFYVHTYYDFHISIMNKIRYGEINSL